MNILIVNNHSLLNAGDYAILLQTLVQLQTAFPGCTIELSFNDPETARRMLPDLAVFGSWLRAVAPLEQGVYRMRPRWRRASLLLQLGVSLLAWRLAGQLLPLFRDRELRTLFRAYARADLVLACGGGYLYTGGPHEGLLSWFGFTTLGPGLATAFEKPLVLLPQSLGPLHDQQQRRMLRWMLERAALILVRERRSLELLRELESDGRALLMPDLAFNLASAPAEQARTLLEQAGVPFHLRRVGITALNWAGQNYAFRAQEQYEAALIACINALTAQQIHVLLFAQCCGPSEVEDDRRVNQRIAGQLQQPEQVTLLSEPLAPPLLQAAYGQLDLLIGTRMHSLILALNAGTPVIGIGYLHKTSGVLADLNLQDWILPIEQLTSADLLRAVQRCLAGEWQAEPARYQRRVARAFEAMQALLRSLMERS